MLVQLKNSDTNIFDNIGLVDMSAEANNWTDLIAPDKKPVVSVIPNTATTVNTSLTVAKSAKKQVALYIDYFKSNLDATATITLE